MTAPQSRCAPSPQKGSLRGEGAHRVYRQIIGSNRKCDSRFNDSGYQFAAHAFRGCCQAPICERASTLRVALMRYGERKMVRRGPRAGSPLAVRANRRTIAERRATRRRRCVKVRMGRCSCHRTDRRRRHYLIGPHGPRSMNACRLCLGKHLLGRFLARCRSRAQWWTCGCAQWFAWTLRYRQPRRPAVSLRQPS